MNDNEQELNNMLHDLNINEMMIEEGENINTRLRSIFKFFNKRIHHYNLEIQILTSKIIKLRREMHECYEILEDYHKDIDKYSKIEMMECKLCRDDISNCVIEPCKHVVCCDNCVKKIEDGKCPVCRVEYTRYYKIYF